MHPTHDLNSSTVPRKLATYWQFELTKSSRWSILPEYADIAGRLPATWKYLRDYFKNEEVHVSVSTQGWTRPLKFERGILLHRTRNSMFYFFEKRAKSRASVRQMQIPGIHDNKLTKNWELQKFPLRIWSSGTYSWLEFLIISFSSGGFRFEMTSALDDSRSEDFMTFFGSRTLFSYF